MITRVKKIHLECTPINLRYSDDTFNDMVFSERNHDVNEHAVAWRILDRRMYDKAGSETDELVPIEVQLREDRDLRILKQ